VDRPGEFVPTQNRSWFSLIAFCALHAVVAALALAILFASASLAFAVAQPRQPNPAGDAVASATFAGMITDSSCGAKHAKESNQAPAECARACVRKGSKYTLVDGDKVHVLDGKTAELDSLAGQRATVVGTLDGDTIRVTSVTAQ
jgi:hypothetical protein